MFYLVSAGSHMQAQCKVLKISLTIPFALFSALATYMYLKNRVNFYDVFCCTMLMHNASPVLQEHPALYTSHKCRNTSPYFQLSRLAIHLHTSSHGLLHQSNLDTSSLSCDFQFYFKAHTQIEILRQGVAIP